MEKWQENGERERRQGNCPLVCFRFPSPQLPCAIFPLSPFPSLLERRKRPLQRREMLAYGSLQGLVPATSRYYKPTSVRRSH